MARSRIGQDILTFVPAVPPLVHPLLRKTFRAMAAENELQLWSPQAANAQRAADAAIADVRRIEAKVFALPPGQRHRAHQRRRGRQSGRHRRGNRRVAALCGPLLRA
jgi:hypothetical protein